MNAGRALLLCAVAILALAPSAPVAAVAQDGEASRGASRELRAGERLVFRGYSVRLPEGGPWQVLPSGVFDVGLLAARSQTHSFGMTASAMRVERSFATPGDFLEYMRARLRAEPDPRRFSDVEIQAELEPSVAPLCVQARSKARDHAPAGPGPYLMLEIWNLTCLHPASPHLAVSVVYYERYAPGETPGGMRPHGRRFLESLRFETPVQPLR
jgi:hypothetical protein